jgi:hypothetical protein
MLGFRIFAGYWCEISFSQSKIFLYKEQPVHFTKSAPVEMIDKYYFCIPVTVDGETLPFCIDTGLPDAMLFPKSAINRKDSADYAKVRSNDRVRDFYIVKTNTVSVLDETFIDSSVLTNSYMTQNNSASKKAVDTDFLDTIGLVGVDFLRNYNLLLDLTDIRHFKTGVLYYEPSRLFEENDYGSYYQPMSNISPFGLLRITRPRDDVVIQDIIESSIAYTDFGFRPGMVVTKINGEPIDGMTDEEFMADDFPDKITGYTIWENGQERTITPVWD